MMLTIKSHKRVAKIIVEMYESLNEKIGIIDARVSLTSV